jgi:hypothetical protein
MHLPCFPIELNLTLELEKLFSWATSQDTKALFFMICIPKKFDSQDMSHFMNISCHIKALILPSQLIETIFLLYQLLMIPPPLLMTYHLSYLTLLSLHLFHLPCLFLHHHLLLPVLQLDINIHLLT